MDAELLKMFGEGPYPQSFEHFAKNVDLYMDSGICITMPKLDIDFPASSNNKTRKGNIERAIEYIRDNFDGEYTLEEAANMAN